MPEWLEKVLDDIGFWLEEHAIAIIAILVIALAVHLIGKRLIGKTIRKAASIDKPISGDIAIEEKRQVTLIRIFDGILVVVVWTVAIMMALSEAGIPIGPMVAAAGVAGLAIGFGGQYLIRDLITGLFIIIENQYRIGDIICVETVCGQVEDITLRKTTLRDLDGIVHHVPHGEIKIVSNQSKSYSRVNVDIRISYNVDIEKAVAVINRVGQEMAEDQEWKEDIIEPPAFARVEDLAESFIILKVLGDTSPGEQYRVAGELRKRIKIAFDEAGIEIPFPQRVVHKAEE